MYYIDKIERDSKELEWLKDDARKVVIDALEAGYTGYGADFHHTLFNLEAKYEDEADAILSLESIGTFDCIKVVRDYEMDNFGKVYTDFSNPVRIANMLWYILGEETIDDLLSSCNLWDDCWDRNMTKEDCDTLLEYIFKEV